MLEIKVEKIGMGQLEKAGVFLWPIWEKGISRFDWKYDSTEECYLLDGLVTITCENGISVSFGKGDFVTFPKGLKCVWDIKSPVRKHYNFK